MGAVTEYRERKSGLTHHKKVWVVKDLFWVEVESNPFLW